MKNKYNFLIFTIFTVLLAPISNAAFNYLYLIDQIGATSKLKKCHIDKNSGQFGECSIDHSIDDPILNSIAVPENGEYVYIAGSRGSLFVCFINDDDGKLDCENNHKEAPKTHIVKMAIDLRNRKLYYIGHRALSSCSLDSVGMYSSCKELKNNLREATSLAISPNGNYVYITIRATSSVLICLIQDDGSLGECNNNANAQFVAPLGIALNNHSRYAYIVDGQSLAGVAKSCLITDGGMTLGACNSYTPLPGYINGATSITLSPDGRYSYISFPTHHTIVRCNMTESGAYTNCHSESPGFRSPQEVAYR